MAIMSEDLLSVAVVWFDQSGRIVQYGSIQKISLILERAQGAMIVEGAGTPDLFYVEDPLGSPAVEPRQANSAKLTGTTLDFLPVPCTLEIVDANLSINELPTRRSERAEESPVQLVFDTPGSYSVQVIPDAASIMAKTFLVVVP